MYGFTFFLTTALVGDERSALCSSRFTLGTYCIGSLEGCEASQNNIHVEKGKK
jgi:hypothetical protein